MDAAAQAFQDFEHAGWERVPQGYDRSLAVLTSQFIEPLLDAAAVGDGACTIDIATGTGHAAAAAARRGAAVLGLDFSAAMLGEARRRYRELEFREGDAQALPFADGSFDAAVMNFGLLHLPQPERALAEACRVLRPRGRFAFTVWAPPEQAVGLGLVLGAIQRHGDMSVPLPPGPPFFRFSDTAECERALRAAGFDAPRVALVMQRWRLPSADALFDTMLHGTVRTAALLRAQTDAARTTIRAALRDAVAPYRSAADEIELPMPAVLASAARP